MLPPDLLAERLLTFFDNDPCALFMTFDIQKYGVDDVQVWLDLSASSVCIFYIDYPTYYVRVKKDPESSVVRFMVEEVKNKLCKVEVKFLKDSSSALSEVLRLIQR